MQNPNAGRDIIIGASPIRTWAELEARYLAGLYHECNELPLARQGPVDQARPRQPRLQQVYVDLHTTTGSGLRLAAFRLKFTAAQQNVVDALLSRGDSADRTKRLDPQAESAPGITTEDLKAVDKALGLTQGASGATACGHTFDPLDSAGWTG